MQFRRIASVLALALAASATLGANSAQAVTGTTVADPLGDVVLVANPSGKHVPATKAATVDIISFTVGGSEDAVTYGLEVGSIAAAATAGAVAQFDVVYEDAREKPHTMLIAQSFNTAKKPVVVIDGKKVKTTKGAPCATTLAVTPDGPQVLTVSIDRSCLGETEPMLAMARASVKQKSASATDSFTGPGQVEPQA